MKIPEMNRKGKLGAFGVFSAVLCAVFLLAAGILHICRLSLASSLPDQLAAQRWAGREAAQLSAFYAQSDAPSVSTVTSVAQQIDTALTAASLTAENENARLWYAAYSTEREYYARTDRGGTTLCLTLFGGDYFLIHQPTLVSGSYLQSGGKNAGAIFLDENAAWKLFGATDVVGLTLTMGEYEFTVCGVGEVPHGTAYDDAYGEMPRAYVLYDAPLFADTAEFTVYEAVLPNPIDGFAMDVFSAALPEGVFLENSARFGTLPLWQSLAVRERLGTRTDDVSVPWFENQARVSEYRCASLLLASVLCLIVPTLLALIWIGIAWNPTGRALKNGWHRLREALEDASVRRYQKRMSKTKHKGDFR